MDQELTQLEKFKVEGQTEDIEIYLRNKEPIYIQAKAQENSVLKEYDNLNI